MRSSNTLKKVVYSYWHDLIMIALALACVFKYVNSLIMNTPRYYTKAIEKFLKDRKIATFDQLKGALGNPVRSTIFRKLAEMEYLSSYSHRGKYYLNGVKSALDSHYEKD